MDKAIGAISMVFKEGSEQQIRELQRFYIKLVIDGACEVPGQTDSSSALSACPRLTEDTLP